MQGLSCENTEACVGWVERPRNPPSVLSDWWVPRALHPPVRDRLGRPIRVPEPASRLPSQPERFQFGEEMVERPDIDDLVLAGGGQQLTGGVESQPPHGTTMTGQL